MLESILALIPAPILAALGTGAATVPCVWGLIEYLLPHNSTTLVNRLTNVGCNVGTFVLLQVSDQVSYGPGWKGILAALVYGTLSSGLTDMFHSAIRKFAPGITNPSGG